MFKANREETGWVWCAALILGLFSAAGFAGTLDPPGPPAPTMKTLDQAQPRIPVTALPGSAQSLFVISEPGSYYLTGDITGVSGKNGIEIASNNVTLDLNGFNLWGVSGSLCGITTDLYGEVRDIIVKNGNVSAWGLDGIRLQAHSALISHVEARVNGEKGISVWHGIVEFCQSRNNSMEGLELVESGIVRHSTVIDNGIGIHATKGLVQGCMARGNGIGIDIGLEGQVIDCFAKNNSNGIRVYLNTLVSRCSVLENGFGVQVLNDGSRNRIEGNTFLSNDYGLVIDPSATRNVVLKNTFHKNATASYTIPPDNPFGPIIDARGLGDLSGVPGADHPWANFLF